MPSSRARSTGPLPSSRRDFARERTELLFSGEYDARPAILSISAGAGGTEATDWAAMLLRMYLRWAERHRWKTEIIDEQEGEQAGLKSVSVAVNGKGAYGWLRAERGVHRLVRISPFDAQNRRQTTFGLVEVMPEPDEDVPIELDWDEIRVDTYRSQGAGGQHVNKTDSAVRLTHLPTGHRRPEPERAQPDPEQGNGDQGPQGAAARAPAGGEGGGAAHAPRRARRGWLGQPDPELRAPPVPDGQGPAHPVRDVEHGRGARRRPGLVHAGRARAGGDAAATTVPRPAGISIRPALESDLAACHRIWRDSLDAYLGRLCVPPLPEDNPGVRRLHGHTRATDPDRFLVAERSADGGERRVVAFGSAVDRGPLWFLSMLFVEPGEQASGIGRALLDELLPSKLDGRVLATNTDSAQPVSNGLYTTLRHRAPDAAVQRRGAATAGIRLARAPGRRADRARREPWRLARERRARRVRRRAPRLRARGGPPVRPGGAASRLRDPQRRRRAPGIRLRRRDRPRWPDRCLRAGAPRARSWACCSRRSSRAGASAVWLPGAADDVLATAIRAGLRIEGFPVIAGWTRPYTDYTRYVPTSPGLV